MIFVKLKLSIHYFRRNTLKSCSLELELPDIDMSSVKLRTLMEESELFLL